jgi:TonB-linked SusC/RagA family outer membrane protein
MNRVCRWVMLLSLCMPAVVAEAQGTGTVRGRVTEANTGAPATDVQVRIEGTSIAAVTRANGEYVLSDVPSGRYDLTARRVGFAPERRGITVAPGATVAQDFTLRVAAITLGEVIVTGVATPTTRAQLGNAIETVAGEDVAEAPGATAIDQALQGRVTGAVISENSGQPGGGVSVRLRGTNSILGGAEPLYVVDGVIVDNNLEALTGLGANAPRGGAALSNRMADLDPADVERIEVLKGAAAAALYGARANNGVIQIFTKRGAAGAPRLSASTDFSWARTPKKYEFAMLPQASAADVAFGGAPSRGATIQRYDIQDQIFRTGMGNTNRLSASGGTGPTTYYVAGSYDREEGILRSTDYTRTSARANLSHRLTNQFDLTVRGNYIRSKARFMPEGEQTYGVLTSLVFTPTSVNPNFDPNTGRYRYNPILGANPLDVLENWEAPEKVTRFVGGLEGTFRPWRDVTLRYLAGIDDYRREVKLLIPQFATSATSAGSIQNPVQFSRLFTNDLTASHVLQLTESFTLNSGAGFRYTADKSETVRAAASDLPPGQTLVGGAILSASQGQTELRTTTWYIEERASWADRLFLTGGLNWDASSAFGPDERTQMFRRLSLSYLLDREPFWQRSLGNFLSSFRLRAAWGQTGGQPPGLYARFANYLSQSFSGRPGLVSSVLAGNPDLRPERQREVEGGFDAGFWNDRAQIEFTVYDKKTKDLVLSVPLPLSSAFQSQFQNIGTLTNKGVELALNTVNINSPRLTWRSRFTYAANRNKVTKLVAATDTLVFDYLNAVIEGQPIGVFYGWFYARTPDGQIAYFPFTTEQLMLPTRATDTISVGPPVVTVLRRKILGDPNPDFVATFSNTIDFADRFQFSILLDGRFGNDVANFTRRIQDHFGASKIVEREITGDTIPRTFANSPSGRINIYEEFIEDGSYVKLREVALDIRLNPGMARLLRAGGGSLRLAGRNLATWTDYTGLDPEINLFSASTVSRGVDFATVPLPRQFSIGLSLNY